MYLDMQKHIMKVVDIQLYNKTMYYMTLLQPQFFQECLYKYRTVQYTLGEKDREKIILSTDVNWHCESSKDVIHIQAIILICCHVIVAQLFSYHKYLLQLTGYMAKTQQHMQLTSQQLYTKFVLHFKISASVQLWIMIVFMYMYSTALCQEVI